MDVNKTYHNNIQKDSNRRKQDSISVLLQFSNKVANFATETDNYFLQEIIKDTKEALYKINPYPIKGSIAHTFSNNVSSVTRGSSSSSGQNIF